MKHRTCCSSIDGTVFTSVMLFLRKQLRLGGALLPSDGLGISIRFASPHSRSSP